MEDFNETEWKVERAYDDLFSYPDDRSFAYYTQLLYAAYHDAYYEGYDEIDLNGDGVDELVILNEDYTLKAIFTMKKGVPVLLDAYANEACWIDEEGMIHVDRWDYNEIEYSLYEFTGEGDYNLVYSIFTAQNGKRYLKKDGKTESITYERFKEIYYDEYRPFYTEPFEAEEYNRAVSGLTYTPLIPYAEDPVKAAVTKVWLKSVMLNEISGEAVAAYSDTYVTFENATDTELDVHVKYAYTVIYPDSDNEYHTMEKTTDFYLDFTAKETNGVFAFEADGIKGHLEFGSKNIWLVIEESTDKHFPVGYHCLSEYIPGK